MMAEARQTDDQFDRLSQLKRDERATVGALSPEMRRTLEAVAIPDDLAARITRSLASLGTQAAYAVRSSATAEDAPMTSFAGLHDTYLNVVGAGRDPPAHQPVLGLAVHFSSRDGTS